MPNQLAIVEINRNNRSSRQHDLMS